jgi:CheY-like chemotaxis protein
LHHGRIVVDSTPGRGATFIVDLPAHASDPVLVPTPAAPEPRKSHRRVLVVDDEPDVADTLSTFFEELGHEVTVALGGESGWERLTAAADGYDLVTLDLRMPDLSGPRLWDRLVAAGSPHVDRIVFVTGDSVDEQTQCFLQQTGRPVLTKPFQMSELAALI